MSFTAHERFASGFFSDEGSDPDLDSAFEDAVDTARIDYGIGGVIPSVASFSASDLEVVSTEPLSLARALMLMRRQEITPGVVYAQALASDAQFKRKALTLKFEDDELKVGHRIGVLDDVPLSLEEEILKRLEASELEVPQPSTLESLELKVYRARYKAVSLPHPGKNKNQFVARRAEGGPILAKGATLGEAKRNALVIAKEESSDGLDVFTLHVSAAPLREDGNPPLEITRTRLSQKGTLRATLASSKKPELKTTGWLFYGQVEAP